jgi:hypothetical protein
MSSIVVPSAQSFILAFHYRYKISLSMERESIFRGCIKGLKWEGLEKTHKTGTMLASTRTKDRQSFTALARTFYVKLLSFKHTISDINAHTYKSLNSTFNDFYLKREYYTHRNLK